MSVMFANVFHSANKCRFACFLKLMSAVSFFYAVHIAIYHQTDVPPYPFILLVSLVAVIAVLALATHSICQFSNVKKTGEID